MTPKVWGWAGLGLAALAGGLFLMTKDDWHAAVPFVGCALLALGAIALLCVLLTRRTRLIADAEMFTFANWRGSRSIPWHRLSSVQYPREGNALVVVNDNGRAEMEIPLHLFDRKALNHWLSTIPARTPAQSRLGR